MFIITPLRYTHIFYVLKNVLTNSPEQMLGAEKSRRLMLLSVDELEHGSDEASGEHPDYAKDYRPVH